jgi:hypothetical protein
MRLYYITACTLLVLALACDIVSKHCFNSCVVTKAKAVDQGPVAYETAKTQSNAALTTGGWFNGAGMLLALGGVIAWVTSMLKGRREGKQMPSAVPFALAVAYVLVYLVCV